MTNQSANVCESNSQVSAKALQSVGLFEGVEAGALEQFAAGLSVSRAAPGGILFREGDDGGEMFVVLQGEFEVLKRSKRGVDTRIALLGEGDWFGEMSVLDVSQRSATVRSLAVSKLVVIERRKLQQLREQNIEAYGQFIYNLAKELCRRLRVSDGILANLAASLMEELISQRHGSAT